MDVKLKTKEEEKEHPSCFRLKWEKSKSKQSTFWKRTQVSGWVNYKLNSIDILMFITKS